MICWWYFYVKIFFPKYFLCQNILQREPRLIMSPTISNVSTHLFKYNRKSGDSEDWIFIWLSWAVWSVGAVQSEILLYESIFILKICKVFNCKSSGKQSNWLPKLVHNKRKGNEKKILLRWNVFILFKCPISNEPPVATCWSQARLHGVEQSDKVKIKRK